MKNLLEAIITWFVNLFIPLKSDIVSIPKPIDTNLSQAPNLKPMDKPKYLWDTPTNARHSVRVIADEMGLNVAGKNILCQVIDCESGFHVGWIHENKDKNGKVCSTDYGICMWNDFYHREEITPDEALHDPEKAVRLMITYFKQGRLNQWVCFSKGLYKSHPA